MQLHDKAAYSNRIAKRSPVEKAFLALGLLALCLLLPPWPACPIAFALASAATLLVARVPFAAYAKALSAPLAFLLLSCLTLAFSVELKDGAPAIALSPEGMREASNALLRSLSAISCLLFMALTTPLPELLSLLRKCRTPAPLIETALLIYNWLFALLDTMREMRTAQEARNGYSSPKLAMKSAALLASGLLIRSFERAKRLETGLAARGFNGDLRVLEKSAKPSKAVLAGTALILAAAALGSLLLGGAK